MNNTEIDTVIYKIIAEKQPVGSTELRREAFTRLGAQPYLGRLVDNALKRLKIAKKISRVSPKVMKWQIVGALPKGTLGNVIKPLRCGCSVEGAGTNEDPLQPVLCLTHASTFVTGPPIHIEQTAGVTFAPVIENGDMVQMIIRVARREQMSAEEAVKRVFGAIDESAVGLSIYRVQGKEVAEASNDQ